MLHNLLAQEPTRLVSGKIIDEGVGFHDKGEFKKAIELYKQVNRNDTNYVRALYELGLSYAADSQYNKAIAAYQEGLYSSDDREREPDFYNSYGSLLDNMNQQERAIAVLDSGIAKYPAYSSLYLNKGITLLRMGKLDEAEVLFKNLLLMDPYSYSSHYLLGQIALQKGRIVQAFISSFSYLMMNPSGRYYQNSISTLNIIASYKDELKKYLEERKEEPTGGFQMMEELILSKIALDKNYKPLVKIDDPICRQIQVLLEKIEYDESDKDFWMQYYVPMYKALFTNKRFEPFINHIFSNVDIAVIKEYNKKHKKENEELINEIVAYCNDIRSTRELEFPKRSKASIIYSFENGILAGKGPVSKDGEAIGDWEYYYKYGNLRSKGGFTDKSQKTGEWQYYHFNQQKSAIERFKNGLVEGEIKHYFSNGNLSSLSAYQNSELEGLKKEYYLSGAESLSENYKAGKLNGEKRIYYLSGLLHYIENFRSDTLHGLYESYYENGQLEYRTEYTAGKLEGKIKGWHDNGVISFEGQYANNELNGEWKRYFDNGVSQKIENYKNGVLEGDYTEYHKNGKLYYKAIYKKGKATGDVIYTDPEGKFYSKLVFKNDILTEAYYYDTIGNEISRSQLKNKKLNLVTYDFDRIKTAEVPYNEKGLTEGTETHYLPSGKTKSIDQYSKGELNGLSVEFYENGKKSSEIPFVDKQKHGYIRTYHPNGKLKSEGWYSENEAEGDWKFYNSLGELTNESYYLDDDAHKFQLDYWPNGKIKSETENAYGWLKKYVKFDTNGVAINKIDLTSGTGAFTDKHFNGKISAAGQYVNGRFHGPYTFYFFDGSPETYMHYKHGILDSLYKDYFYGGVLHIEGQYKMGKKTGTWKTYYKSGKLEIEEKFKDGELEGKKIFYYENGKVDKEYVYEGGLTKGLSSKFNESGELMYAIYYKEGNMIGYSYNDKNGKLMPMISMPQSASQINSFYKTGAQSALLKYSDGVTNGKYQIFHPNGKLAYESTEEFGLTQGLAKSYHSNGQLKESLSYIDNQLQGPFAEFNEKGQKIIEGNYYQNEMHGPITFYDEINGNQKQVRLYYFGTLISVKK